MTDRIFFSLRDDDTSYFTRPEHLERCYKRIWRICPISLSVVPFHGCTKSGALPREYWRGDRMFPLASNGELVAFLRENMSHGRIHVTLHGYHHRDEVRGFEFVAGADLDRKVRDGRQYLESLLGQPVTVFVPPHNALSWEGYRAVVRAGLHISGIQSFHPSFRGWDPRIAWLGLKRRWWYGQHGCEWPWPLVFPDGHREVPHLTVSPSVGLDHVMRAFRSVLKTGGVFCLATHYWEFDAPSRCGSVTVREMVEQLWEEAQQHVDRIEFLPLGRLAEVNRP
ncbi:MAG TPA: DUF2334 domain-containing protein [Phycisphaerae bacterium]|nr:DUF2334 domain-containing protein [Phycisphaerae bacterium]HRR84509.1 DUF2334 domain-containing protein [Phycisphaerae bacterium]